MIIYTKHHFGFSKNRNKIILRIIRKFSLGLCAASRQRNAV